MWLWLGLALAQDCDQVAWTWPEDGATDVPVDAVLLIGLDPECLLPERVTALLFDNRDDYVRALDLTSASSRGYSSEQDPPELGASTVLRLAGPTLAAEREWAVRYYPWQAEPMAFGFRTGAGVAASVTDPPSLELEARDCGKRRCTLHWRAEIPAGAVTLELYSPELGQLVAVERTDGGQDARGSVALSGDSEEPPRCLVASARGEDGALGPSTQVCASSSCGGGGRWLLFLPLFLLRKRARATSALNVPPPPRHRLRTSHLRTGAT